MLRRCNRGVDVFSICAWANRRMMRCGRGLRTSKTWRVSAAAIFEFSSVSAVGPSLAAYDPTGGINFSTSPTVPLVNSL